MAETVLMLVDDKEFVDEVCHILRNIFKFIYEFVALAISRVYIFQAGQK